MFVSDSEPRTTLLATLESPKREKSPVEGSRRNVQRSLKNNTRGKPLKTFRHKRTPLHLAPWVLVGELTRKRPPSMPWGPAARIRKRSPFFGQIHPPPRWSKTHFDLKRIWASHSLQNGNPLRSESGRPGPPALEDVVSLSSPTSTSSGGPGSCLTFFAFFARCFLQGTLARAPRSFTPLFFSLVIPPVADGRPGFSHRLPTFARSTPWSTTRPNGHREKPAEPDRPSPEKMSDTSHHSALRLADGPRP